MEIRAYRDDDLETLRTMMVESFDGVSIDQAIEQHCGRINDRDWGWRKGRHLDADVARDREGIFVADEGGRAVGFITTWVDDAGGIGHIPNLAVDQEFRGRGIGRKLLEVALEHFRVRGVKHAKIETLAQNGIGNHLYPSLGFVEVARQVHFIAEL